MRALSRVPAHATLDTQLKVWYNERGRIRKGVSVAHPFFYLVGVAHGAADT